MAGGQLQRSIAIRAQAVKQRAEVQRERATLLRRKTENMSRVATRRAGLLQAARAIDAEIQGLAGSSAKNPDPAGEAKLADLDDRRRDAYNMIAKLDQQIDDDVRPVCVSCLGLCSEYVSIARLTPARCPIGQHMSRAGVPERGGRGAPTRP